MILPTCSAMKRGRGTLLGLIWAFLSQTLTRPTCNSGGGVGTLKVTIYTEAGILVFDMGG